MSIIYKIGADSNMGMVRKNNEDNYTVSADLQQGWGWVNDQQYSLGPWGSLLVVADGMGGMNAGEVASEIAIQTVQSMFTAENIISKVSLNDPKSVVAFMNETIVKADANIKAQAAANPANKGMGTTIVIGWLLGDKLYVSWCGDSRAYVFNPAFGLHQISVDHSYVQTLVEKGAISREAAFDFPESNVITRSLCDAIAEPAEPENLVQPYTVANGDIIILCTDGLSGMIRDNQMQSVIENSPDDMRVIVDRLIQSACAAGGTDNVTVVACEIVSGAAEPNPSYFVPIEKRLNGVVEQTLNKHYNNFAHVKPGDAPKQKAMIRMAIIAAVFVLFLGAIVFFFTRGPQPIEKPADAPENQEQGFATGEEDVQYAPSPAAVSNPAAGVVSGGGKPNSAIVPATASTQEGEAHEGVTQETDSVENNPNNNNRQSVINAVSNLGKQDSIPNPGKPGKLDNPEPPGKPTPNPTPEPTPGSGSSDNPGKLPDNTTILDI